MRARQFKVGEVLRSLYDFAPLPVERAVRSNRMSPADVVMFYGSDDSATAIAEKDDDPEVGIAVGTFRSTRNAKILDLFSLLLGFTGAFHHATMQRRASRGKGSRR
jgi:hypothetical protein